MLKIVIIDDEKNVRIVIKKLLSLIHVDIKVVGEAASIIDAKEILLKQKPDIVLLDIELEDGSGFDLLNQLTKIDFTLIFITAFNEYAIKAFKFNAIDYILKPIDPTELKTAILKAKSIVNSDNEIKELLNNLESNKYNTIQKLVVKTTQKTYFIPLNEIQYFESDGSYSKIVTDTSVILTSKYLKYFQEVIPDEVFIRSHQSFLVNKHKVVAIKRKTLLLKNGNSIPISARRLSAVKDKLK